MHILAVGLNHKTAPLEIRERLAFSRKQCRDALSTLFNHVPEGVILSTCNRTEIYTLADHEFAEKHSLEHYLCEIGDMPIFELKPHLYSLHHEEAIDHLFRVAAGLESMVLGEYEILGQVGDALYDAESTKVVSYPLLNLFKHAVRIGRRVRTETEISRNPVSVSSVAIDLARKKIGDLSGCKILVISAGEASKLAIKALANHGVSDFIVASRSYDKAHSLALEYGGRAVSLHNLREPLIEADIVVSCSGAPHFLVKSHLVEDAMHIRADRPLVLIDIAVPRDVDPVAKEIANVYLYNIDDLQSVSASNQRRRAKEKERVISIIDEEVYNFKSWWYSLEAVPTISALTSKAESIRAAQLYKTMAEIQVSREERAAIDSMTQAIVKKILHDPITNIRNNGNGNNYIQAVQELFNLDNIA